jgi:hypothetical protein
LPVNPAGIHMIERIRHVLLENISARHTLITSHSDGKMPTQRSVL